MEYKIIPLVIIVVFTTVLFFSVIPVADWKNGFRFRKGHPVATRICAAMIIIAAILRLLQVTVSLQWIFFLLGAIGLIFVRDAGSRMKR